MSADLALERLSFAHPGTAEYAVEEFSLSVPAGQMVALLGASGSGKSTVLRLIAGLEQPNSGTVRIGGASAAGTAPERRGVTMMFQKPLLFPHLSVIDNVAFADRIAGRPRQQARANAARYLDLVHLGDMADRRSRQLSGGQEQRVSLARALAARPAVLLLDEPFGALDTAVRASMYELLEEVRAMLDPTIVLVTHDLTEAALADRVAVLANGGVVQEGTVPQLHAQPASLQVARLLGGFAEVPGDVHDGVHHSAAGTVRLPAPAGLIDGPATLLIHRHSVTVTPVSASTTGTSGSVTGSVGTDPTDDVVGQLSGVVTRVRSTGLRHTLTLTVGSDPRQSDGGSSLEAEIGPHGDNGSPTFTVGSEVTVHLIGPGVWAVPRRRLQGDHSSVTYSAP
ncbi:MAG: ABC transporter ATP-binding protein [Ornithinimicrobium sp.]